MRPNQRQASLCMGCLWVVKLIVTHRKWMAIWPSWEVLVLADSEKLVASHMRAWVDFKDARKWVLVGSGELLTMFWVRKPPVGRELKGWVAHITHLGILFFDVLPEGCLILCIQQGLHHRYTSTGIQDVDSGSRILRTNFHRSVHLQARQMLSIRLWYNILQFCKCTARLLEDEHTHTKQLKLPIVFH